MDNLAEDEPEYENRIVVFIDILGFKEVVESKSVKEICDAIESVHKLQEEQLFSEVYEPASGGELNPIDKQITVFSDSIVISFVNSNELKYKLDLQNFFSMICRLQNNLAKFQEKLIRGGITEGLLYHKKDVCFGPALNRAYYLESVEAEFPRVLIDDCVIRKYGFNESDLFISIKDEKFYLDFLKIYRDYITSPHRAEDSILFSLLQFQKLIINGLNHTSSAVRKKYTWLAQEFNDVIGPTIDKEGAIEWFNEKLERIKIEN